MDLINYGYSSDEAELVADEEGEEKETSPVHPTNGKYSEESENDSIGYELEGTPSDSIKTPASQQLQDSPTVIEQKLALVMDYEGLPPSPPGPCSVELTEKFIRLFGYKDNRGLNMNAQILNRKEFKNPAIYDKLKEDYGVNEYGTNYFCTGKDNIALDPSDYYDKLSEDQSKLLDQEEKGKKPVDSAKQ